MSPPRERKQLTSPKGRRYTNEEDASAVESQDSDLGKSLGGMKIRRKSIT